MNFLLGTGWGWGNAAARVKKNKSEGHSHLFNAVTVTVTAVHFWAELFGLIFPLSTVCLPEYKCRCQSCGPTEGIREEYKFVRVPLKSLRNKCQL